MNACGACEVTTRTLKRCPCLEVSYCSARCQNEAWQQHKKACQAARASLQLYTNRRSGMSTSSARSKDAISTPFNHLTFEPNPSTPSSKP
mmetsp:Transcript_43042/g.69227  ORF Transcript_43042/g.69227 Transcript_43042/m.69227 type:complete len:90 (-) Transcript_43042:17-286(-)